ncbi:hypothetical protein [Crassaminicella profunda]|uniref:hypothetical protein n=1 Tax=Crassaminicella profunda TaxID=1286698 RepID=UPI001CA6B746|nr:hypothetical protein [Crassaminicella profunda]QZY53712.1 hypothetical protein K7H06_11635 [Crassaminicella profunda]
MNDGRYYTAHQFLNIIALTMLIIFVVISIMLCLYKGSGNKGIKNIIFVYIGLAVAMITRFIEEVIVSQSTAYVMRYVSSIVFVVVNYMLIYFLIKYVLKEFYKHNKILMKILKNMIYVVLCAGLTIGALNKKLIINSYSFFYMRFGFVYKHMIIVCLLLILFINTFLFFLSPNRDMKRFKFNNRFFATIQISLWGIPLIIYSISIVTNQFDFYIAELIMYLFLSINLSVVSNYFMPYRVTTPIFSNVKDLVLDYVFIIDTNGKIMYRNKRVEESKIFKDIGIVHEEKIEEIFSKEVIKRNDYNKLLIEYIDQTNKYLSYNEKEIKNKGAVVGKIITFIDRTALIKMLDKLKEQQIETEKTYRELSHYSKIVYDLEKEKEINALLEEIASTREKSMEKLKENIENLIENSDDDPFIVDIEKIIQEAKKDLFDVRQAVSAYMSYYGGQND